MTVPYTFASSSGSIPLSYLDSNFSTAITMGNTAVQLGDTITTFNNVTLASPTITTPNMSGVTINSGNATVTSLTATTVTASGNVQMASANGGQLAGLRNRLINGQTIITQRGQISVTSAYQYSADRWLVALSSATVITSTSNIGFLSGSPSGYGLYISGTWTTGSPTWSQKIEAANVADLVNKQVTVSGYINFPSGVNDTISVSLFYANARDNFATSTVIATNTTSTITGGSTVSFSTTFSAATMNVSNIANGLQVVISKTNTVTHGTSTNYVLACAQLEVGPVATPFEQRPYGMELALCQRYTLKPAANMAGGTETTTVASFSYSYPVSMRANPSFTSTATTADIRIGGATTTGIAGTWVGNILGTEGAGFQFTRTSLTWTANIPAFLNQSTSIGLLTAEL
jgi:hypothetical protein